LQLTFDGLISVTVFITEQKYTEKLLKEKRDEKEKI
jgi:hypothetical protein